MTFPALGRGRVMAVPLQARSAERALSWKGGRQAAAGGWRPARRRRVAAALGPGCQARSRTGVCLHGLLSLPGYLCRFQSHPWRRGVPAGKQQAARSVRGAPVTPQTELAGPAFIRHPAVGDKLPRLCSAGAAGMRAAEVLS